MKRTIKLSEIRKLVKEAVRTRLTEAYWHPKDDLLSGITFEDLITAIQSNEPKYDMETVNRVFNELVKENMTNAKYELKSNMKNILKELNDSRD